MGAFCRAALRLDAQLKNPLVSLSFLSMKEQPIQPETHRVVGIFSSTEALQKVIYALELKGFDHAQFGVLSTKADQPPRSASEAAADPSTPTDAPDDPESTGTIAAAIVGGLTYVGAMTALGAIVLTGGGLGLALLGMAAAGGAGGIGGLLIAAGFRHEHVESIESQLNMGGLVLWIEPRTPVQQTQALEAMREAGATDVKALANGEGS